MTDASIIRVSNVAMEAMVKRALIAAAARLYMASTGHGFRCELGEETACSCGLHLLHDLLSGEPAMPVDLDALTDKQQGALGRWAAEIRRLGGE